LELIATDTAALHQAIGAAHDLAKVYMSIAKRIETVTIVAVACIAIIVSILDLAGALDGVDWLRNRIPVLTLLVVGAVAAYLISEQASAAQEQKASLHTAIQQVVAASGGIEVHVLASRAEFFLYAAERIRTCSETIDDLTWGLSPKSLMTTKDVAAYKEYRRQIGLVTNGKGENRHKIFREVMSFPDGIRVPLAAALMDRRYPNYHLRVYDYDHVGTPLLLQFYIFDKKEVLIASPSPRGGAFDSRYTSFRSRQLAEVLSHYFEVIWRDAMVLKDTQTIRLDLLEILAQRIGISSLKELKSDRL
jgi:hypothetical protein